jgi:hypothetical protein
LAKPIKISPIETLQNSLNRLESRFNEWMNPKHLASEANMCNEAPKHPMVPVTFQTSDDSKTVNISFPVHQLPHATPEVLRNFLEIAIFGNGEYPNRDRLECGIESIVVQVNYKTPETEQEKA